MSSTLSRLPRETSRGEDLTHWIQKHWAQLALGVGLAAVAFALVIAIIYNRGKLAERAADQVSMARSQAAAGKTKEALDTLDATLRTNRTSAAAMQAYVLKGEMLLTDNRAKEAETVYREALSQAINPHYRPLFIAGIAAAAVEQRAWPEAAVQYEALIKDYPEHFLAPRAYMELGRLQMVQAKWPEAQATLERLVTLYPKTHWAAEAKTYLAEVKNRLPAAPVKPAP